MRLIKFLLIAVLFTAVTVDLVMGFRLPRPRHFSYPLTEADVNDLNAALENLFLMQQGRYEMDTVTTSKTNANNGEMWIEADNGIYEVFYMSGEGVRQLVSSPAYEDLRVGGLGVRLGGAKDPTLTTFQGGTRLYLFDNAIAVSEKEVYATFQMSHQYKEGTDVVPHIHYAKQDAGAGDVRWCWEYSWANVFGDFPATATVCANCTVPTDTLEHAICDLGDVSGTDKKISSTMISRVYRNSSDAGDTYTGDVYMLELDVHFMADTLGSRQEYIK